MNMTDNRFDNASADDYEVIRVGGGPKQAPQTQPAQTVGSNVDPYADYEVVRVGGSGSSANAQQAARARSAQAQRRPRPANGSGQQRRPANGQPARGGRPQQRRAANAPQAKARPAQRSAARRASNAPNAQAGFVPASPQRKQLSRGGGGYVARKQGMSTGAKVGIVILALAILFGLIGGAYYLIKRAEAERDLAGNKTQEELNAIDNELTGTKTYDEPFTMLLLGSDARADDPEMGARTDTVILVRIDPNQNIVSMISIPRDTRIFIDGVGEAKFNAAYFYNGVAGTIAAVKDLTGVEIDHYAEINFEGLVDMVDAVGGVDVYVDELVDDPDAGDVIIEPGEQHLDGAAALTFARSRAYADGDYTRTANQRKIIMGLAHKLLEAPAAELTGLIRNSTKYLTTDMSLDDIMSLADQMRHNNDYPIVIYSNHLPSYPTMIGDVSYVVADEPAVSEMMRAFNAGENIEDAKEEESNEAAADSGAAASGYSYDYGYDDTYTGYADETYYEESGGGYYQDAA